MPEKHVRDVKGDGTLRLNTSPAAGPADRFSSETVINPDGIVREIANDDLPVNRVLGDGRQYMPIQLATPASYSPGQFWLEKIAGITYIVFVDDAGVLQTVTGGGGSVPTPTIVPLTNGVPTQIASVVVDAVGTIEWGVNLYKAATAQRTHFRLVGAHNGTTGADATITQLNQQSTISFGVLDVVLSLTLTGFGPAQTMNLVGLASSVNWIAAVVPERLVSP
jgi:hypothetical protein